MAFLEVGHVGDHEVDAAFVRDRARDLGLARARRAVEQDVGDVDALLLVLLCVLQDLAGGLELVLDLRGKYQPLPRLRLVLDLGVRAAHRSDSGLPVFFFRWIRRGLLLDRFDDLVEVGHARAAGRGDHEGGNRSRDLMGAARLSQNHLAARRVRRRDLDLRALPDLSDHFLVDVLIALGGHHDPHPALAGMMLLPLGDELQRLA